MLARSEPQRARIAAMQRVARDPIALALKRVRRERHTPAAREDAVPSQFAPVHVQLPEREQVALEPTLIAPQRADDADAGLELVRAALERVSQHGMRADLDEMPMPRRDQGLHRRR